MLGHTVGLYRKKRQVQGKAPAEGNDKEVKEPSKPGNKERSQWIANPRDGAHQKENNQKEHIVKSILKITYEIIDDRTHKPSLAWGLSRHQKVVVSLI